MTKGQLIFSFIVQGQHEIRILRRNRGGYLHKNKIYVH